MRENVDIAAAGTRDYLKVASEKGEIIAHRGLPRRMLLPKTPVAGAPMQAEVFHIYHQGEQRGPYTMKQINHLYRAGFIDDETLYWREGMEQWQPVTEIVQRRKRRNRMVVWIVLLSVAAAASLLMWLFGGVTMSAWREMTSGEYTEESAWWRARGLVRHQLADGEHVEFEPFGSASVKLHDTTAATVELGGNVLTNSGAQERRAWRVRLQYDPLKRQWYAAPPAPG